MWHWQSWCGTGHTGHVGFSTHDRQGCTKREPEGFSTGVVAGTHSQHVGSPHGDRGLERVILTVYFVIRSQSFVTRSS